MQKLPARVQSIVDGVNDLICAVFFGFLSHQCLVYARDLKSVGEVSMTLQMPVYPFVYGIALGCLLLTLVLAVQSLKNIAATMEQ